MLFLFMAFSAVIISSCSSDDDSAKTNTKAVVYLKDAQGRPVEGQTVHAFQDSKWELFGFDVFHSDKSVISDEDGKAEFNNLEEVLGTYIIDNQENFHFGVKYVLNGTNKTKSEGKTFRKGDSKEITIIMN